MDHEAAVVPIKWETDASPGLGERAQSVINRQIVDDSDILLGIFWTRLGTPTGEADSGTVEEIERFLAQGKRVLLYFSVAPIPQNSDLDQFNRLQAFRRRCEGRGLIADFDSLEELGHKVEHHMRTTIRELQAQRRPTVRLTPLSPSSEGTLQSMINRYRSQLRRVQAEWSAEQHSDPHGIDEGKRILSAAIASLITLRAHALLTEDSAIAEPIDAILRDGKALQRHHLYMDGGMSFRAFWEEGDALLKRISDALGPLSELVQEKEVT